jgi:hypothetical protein
MPSVEHLLSRRAILGGAAAVGLLPLSSVLPRPTGADSRWIASEHPAFVSVRPSAPQELVDAPPASRWSSLPCARTVWWRSTRWRGSGRGERSSAGLRVTKTRTKVAKIKPE